MKIISMSGSGRVIDWAAENRPKSLVQFCLKQFKVNIEVLASLWQYLSSQARLEKKIFQESSDKFSV